MPSTLTNEEAEHNLLVRVNLQHQQDGGHAWNPAPHDPPEAHHPEPQHEEDPAPEDVASFMARRFVRAVVPSISSSSSTIYSSTSSSPDWRQTVLVVRDGPTVPATLPWHDHDLLLRQVNLVLADITGDVLRTHYVSHRPPDLIQVDLQCLLVQKADDFCLHHLNVWS